MALTKKTVLLFSGILICLTMLGQEQSFIDYSRLLSPEKLYLQTDREVYCIGDTIWFKGYLKNASELSEFKECNYIYVELLSTKWERLAFKGKNIDMERVRNRIKVKRNGDTFEGYLSLDNEELNSGIAVLRAYSYWMMNEEPEYMFNKSIEIRNPIKDTFYGDLVKGRFADNETYLQIGMENPFIKTLFRKKEETKVDVQFFPESGRYAADSKSTIAVKAINGEGLGIKVHGIVLADSTQVGQFETNNLGMGVFQMKVPYGTRKIVSEITTEDEQFQYFFDLPMPQQNAAVINVRTDSLRTKVSVSLTDISLPDSSFLILHDRTEIYFKSQISELDGPVEFENGKLTAGINNAAIVDSKGNVYAQRSFFIFPENNCITSFKTSNPDYKKFEEVLSEISFTDKDGNPVNGNFSISITDDTYTPYSSKNHNILSYWFVGSEIKGLIESPQSYFDDSVPLKKRIADMDALMLTQGWTYYDLPKILTGTSKMPTFGKEYTQSLSGWVHGIVGKAKFSTICFAAPAINFTMIADLDSCAYFSLNELDFPDGTQFVVGAQGRKNFLKKAYGVVLDPEYFACDFSYPKPLSYAGYTDDFKELATRNYYSLGGEITYSIAPARITAQAQLSPYPEDDFKSHQYRSEKALEPYSNYMLADYIAETIPGVVRMDGTTLLCHVKGSGQGMHWTSRWVPILLYVNGFLSSQNEIDNLSVEDIVALAYVQNFDVYKYHPMAGFSDATPTVCVFVKARFPSRVPANVIAEKPIGWQKPAKFYIPKYEIKDQADAPMRATLYWNPELIPANGKASIQFTNSDNVFPRTVVIEGFTEKGTPLFFKTTME